MFECTIVSLGGIGNCGDFNLLRIGRKNQVHRYVCEYSLEYLVEKKMKKLKFSHNKDAMRKELQRLTKMLDSLDNICVKLKMSSEVSSKKEVGKYPETLTFSFSRKQIFLYHVKCIKNNNMYKHNSQLKANDKRHKVFTLDSFIYE